MDQFSADCMTIVEEKLAAGKIDRRQFLKVAALFGAAGPTVLAGREAKAATELVFANWGGDATTAFRQVYGTAFEKSSGIKVAFDTTGPSIGKIRAMVESKKVTWDVMDTTLATAGELGAAGLMEKIDYSIVDKNKVLPGYAQEYGVAGYGFSNVFTYDSSKFGGKKPNSWADFWNLKDFPGKRSLRRDIAGTLEAALMADGVPKDKLYPIDVPRAFKKIAEIKKDCVFWNSGAESQQFLRDGEAVMGTLWNTRGYLLAQDSKGRLATCWNEAIFQSNCWGVPKGNPGGKDVMRLIASMQEPAQQVEILKVLASGPANPAAAAIVPAELKSQNPSDPGNLAMAVQYDVKWYSENQQKVQQQYLDFLAS